MSYWYSVGKTLSLFIIGYGSVFARENSIASGLLFLGLIFYFLFDMFQNGGSTGTNTVTNGEGAE